MCRRVQRNAGASIAQTPLTSKASSSSLGINASNSIWCPRSKQTPKQREYSLITYKEFQGIMNAEFGDDWTSVLSGETKLTFDQYIQENEETAKISIDLQKQIVEFLSPTLNVDPTSSHKRSGSLCNCMWLTAFCVAGAAISVFFFFNMNNAEPSHF